MLFRSVSQSRYHGLTTQSIGQLRVINNENYELEISGAAATLTLGNSTFRYTNPYNTATPNVFEIDSGSVLKLKSATNHIFTLNFDVNTISNYQTDIAGDLIIEPNASMNNQVNMANLVASANTITGRIINNGGIFTATAANTYFGNGSFYIHNRNGGVLPAVGWHPNGSLS